MRKLVIALAALALPLAALAAPPPAAEPGPWPDGPPGPEARFERMEKRMQLARSLGLAEALDLDAAQAIRLAETLQRVEAKRKPVLEQHREAMQVLRRAGAGDKDAQSKVDDAVKKVFDARAQMAALDRESYDAVAKGLPPEKRARVAVFLGRFQQHFDMRMMAGMGPGVGRGMGGMGRGMGPGTGPGWGRGMRRGMGPDQGWHCPDCPWW